MSARFYLYRRNGMYYFRWAIPLQLRRRMPAGSPIEVRLSLRVSSFPAARYLAAQHWLAAVDTARALLVTNSAIRYKEVISAIRGRVGMAVASDASLDGGGFVSLAELAGTTELRHLKDSLAQLHAQGAEFFIEVPPIGVSVWARGYGVDGDPVEDVVEVLDDFADQSARLTRSGLTAALAAERNLFEVRELWSDLPGMWRGNKAMPEYLQVVPVPAFPCNVSSIKVRDRWRQAAAKAPSASPQNSPKASADCEAITLSSAFDLWIRENSQRSGGTWSKSTEDNYSAAVSQFIDIVGDKVTTELTASDFSVYEQTMRSLPKNWAAVRRQTDLSFQQIAFDGALRSKVSPKTLKDKGSSIGVFFRYLKSRGYWHGRYGEILFTGLKQKVGKTERHTFSNSDLQTLFMGAGLECFQKAKFPLYVWGTLLLLYTGARSGEVSQLRPSDVLKSPEGVWCIRIAASECIEGVRQTIKNEASVRHVPLHPALVDLGFMQFVAGAQSRTWLFPEAFRHEQKVSKELGDWVNETLLVRAGLKASGVVLHSFRHTVINRFKHDSTLNYLACAYTGHSTDLRKLSANPVFDKQYGNQYSLGVLAEKLHPLLDYGIDWGPLKDLLEKKQWA